MRLSWTDDYDRYGRSYGGGGAPARRSHGGGAARRSYSGGGGAARRPHTAYRQPQRRAPQRADTPPDPRVSFSTNILSWPKSTYEESQPPHRLDALYRSAPSGNAYYRQFSPHILEEARANIHQGLQGREPERSFRIRMIQGSEKSYLSEPGLLTLRGRGHLPEAFNHSYSTIVFEVRGYEGTPGYFLKKPRFLAIASYEDGGTFKFKIHTGDRDFSKTKSTQAWSIHVRYLTSLVGEQRMWSACAKATPLPYLPALASGRPEPVRHTAFAARTYSTEATCSHLNASQKQAIEQYLTSSRPINIVTGPPGTGKTTATAVLLARLKQKRGERVLVTAPSNKAVHVLLDRFILGNPDCAVIIVGVEEKIPEHLKPFSLYGVQKQLNFCKNTLNTQQAGWRDQCRQAAELTQATKADIKKVRQKVMSHVKNILQATQQITHITTRWNLGAVSADYAAELSQLRDELVKLNWQQQLSTVNTLLGRIQGVLNHATQASRRLPEGDDALQAIIAHSQFIFSTLCVTGQLQMIKNLGHIHHMVVDEAGQATEAETLIAMQHRPEKIALVGDTNQLPATVISQEAERCGFSRSMMAHLIENDWPDAMLDTQYRMHPDICDWPSNTFYRGLLKTPAALAARTLQAAAHSEILQRPRAFYDIKSQEQSKGTSHRNTGEAKAIAKIVKHILDTEALGKKRSSQSASSGCGGGSEKSEDHLMPIKTIGVITFYKAQVEAINQCLGPELSKHVRVSTVDSFQGSECDIIILSCVRSNKHTIGFLNDFRRLNVAVTRPKYCLVVVGNAKLLSLHESHLKNMIEDMRAHKQVFSEKSLLNIIDPKPPQPKRKPKKAPNKQKSQGGGGGKATAKKSAQKPAQQRRRAAANAGGGGGTASVRFSSKKTQQRRRKPTKAAAAKKSTTAKKPTPN